MQIVSNTTPISELYKIGQLELLQRVYNRILIPEAVLQELQRARTLPRLGRAVEQTGWIEIHALRHPDKIQEMLSRYSSIDAGEAAAIILAQELGANRIIMDDKRARQVAQAEGLAVIGTVGVVLLAHRLRRVTTPQAQVILDQLYAGTAYISANLYRDAYRQLQG